ncbi:MAG TPA: hypothetical protein PKE47_01545 [Verrucomicrobiota bacterium]|nr:hypothetical protein [Verrucomicrobiota bacterium]
MLPGGGGRGKRAQHAQRASLPARSRAGVDDAGCAVHAGRPAPRRDPVPEREGVRLVATRHGLPAGEQPGPEARRQELEFKGVCWNLKRLASLSAA